MDERLRGRAERQGGVFTSRDVRACLLGEHDLRGVVGRREAIRVRRDAYVLGDWWRDAWPTQQLALRTRAILRTRPEDVASHHSALALHGVATWGVPPDVVDLLAAVGRTRTVAGVRLHPMRDVAEPVEVSGYRAVCVSVAIVQVALSQGVVPAVVSLDDALHQRMCTLGHVRTAADWCARGPLDRARLDAVLDRTDPLCESVGETRARLLLQDLGYAVRSQVRVCDAQGDLVGRVDFMIGERLVVEFDGMVKYEGADGRGALAREKAREERLTALGCVVVRLVWSDLDQPERVRSMIESALVRLVRRS